MYFQTTLVRFFGIILGAIVIYFVTVPLINDPSAAGAISGTVGPMIGDLASRMVENKLRQRDAISNRFQRPNQWPRL